MVKPMSVAVLKKPEAPEEVSARERLSVAMFEHARRTSRVEAIKQARIDLLQQRFDANRAVEAAAKVLEKSKTDAAKHIADAALGAAGAPPATQKQARQTLLEANERLEELYAASDALAKELNDASERLTFSRIGLDRAKRDVLATSPAVAKLLARYRETLAGLDRMRNALDWLFDKEVVPRGWDSVCDEQDLSLQSEWKAAWTALEENVNAKLPE